MNTSKALKFSEELLQSALEQGESAPLRPVPKTDLHSHSVLASEPIELARFLGRPLDVPEHFGSLERFLFWVGDVLGPLVTERELLAETLKSAISVLERDGVIGAELSLHLPLARLSGQSWTELAPILEGIRIRSPIDLRFELGIPRPISDDFLELDAREALDTGLFAGIDIYDDELFCSLERFVPIIREAKHRGCYVKVHSGEVGGPKEIWSDLTIAEPDAVQHGVRIAEDDDLLRFVRDLQIPLNICPSSNVKLGVVPSLEKHPIRKLFDAGIPVTVNSDDYLAFGQTVSDEFLNLYRARLFTAAELETIRLTGLQRFSTLG